jgi:uncharacterized membrane protein
MTNAVRWPLVVALTLLLAATLLVLVYAPMLPERIAQHFDAAGVPNGWTSRDGFVGIEAFVLAVLAVAFIVLPLVLGKLPARFVNLPHRDYWLAPERRDRSMRDLSDALLWFGCAALVMHIGVSALVIRYNLDGPQRLPSTVLWALLIGFVAFLAMWIVSIRRRFRRPV